MPGILELRKLHEHALQKAERILAAARNESRELTASEEREIESATANATELEAKISEAESISTIRSVFPFGGTLLGEQGVAGVRAPNNFNGGASTRRLGREYQTAFNEYLSTHGQKITAALNEGTGSAGGYAVPIQVAGQIVQLAPPDFGVRSIATVLPTASDVKIPRQTAVSTATAKAEGTGSGSNLFTESEPTLDQFTLSAFMAGVLHQISFELAEDVPSFTQFAINDMSTAQSIYEENKFVNGSGTGEAQGLIGNTGAGVTGVLVGSDNYASELLTATFDVQGQLKGEYHAGASWLMARATSVVLRKAQAASNSFNPVFTRENGRDYLHGYPVTYSTAMPAIGAGNTPVLFGDFRQGYVIGDRGGSGLNVKILDQPKATEGLILLLAYRRTDGRVRRSEAIQPIALHS